MQYSMGNLSFLTSLWEWRTRWTCSLLENEASLCHSWFMISLPCLFSSPLYFLTFPLFLGLSPFHISLSVFFFIHLSFCSLWWSTFCCYNWSLFVWFLFIFKYHVSMNVWNKNLVTYIANPKISIKHFNLQFPELNDDIATFQNC